jgi:hypothetical protein
MRKDYRRSSLNHEALCPRPPKQKPRIEQVGRRSVVEYFCHSHVFLCLVRTLLDFFNSIPGSDQVQMKTLTDNIQWAKTEKKIFLKNNLEFRLAGF